MSTSTYFVQAKISDDGLYAACSYFLDKAATQPVEGSTLSVPMGADACTIQQAHGSELVLLGASFKTLGHAPVMTDSNFSAADGTASLDVPMPTSNVVTKGVVLLFSNSGAVDGLYASSDPELTNGSGA
jgi:hypothetical protein